MLHQDDPEAVFPTAQLVAAMRATDARQDLPRIGANIAGAGPDLAAEVFAGDSGQDLLREYAELFGIDEAEVSAGVVERTRYLDHAVVKTLDAGCHQLVILAAGLDARAWRLPRLDTRVTVFEVDVARASRYKAAVVRALHEARVYTEPHACRRVCVEADLRDPKWTQTLKAAGFNADEPSCFLVEGLTMYLREASIPVLLRACASVMTPGSALAGDALSNMIHARGKNIGWLRSHGTDWTWELAAGPVELQSRLADAGLVLDDVHSIGKHLIHLYHDDGDHRDGHKQVDNGSKIAATTEASKKSEYLVYLALKPEPHTVRAPPPGDDAC